MDRAAGSVWGTCLLDVRCYVCVSAESNRGAQIQLLLQLVLPVLGGTASDMKLSLTPVVSSGFDCCNVLYACFDYFVHVVHIRLALSVPASCVSAYSNFNKMMLPVSCTVLV